MSTLSQQPPAVNGEKSVDLAISARDFAAFCAALRSEFPAWQRNVQIVRKATANGPVAKVIGLNGHSFSAGDVAAIRAVAAEYAPDAEYAPAFTPMAQPVTVVNWPSRKPSRKPSIKLGRGSAWAGVR